MRGVEASVCTLNVDTSIDPDGIITVTVEGKPVFQGNLVEAVAVRGAIDEVLAVSGFAGFSQRHGG